MKKLLKKQVVTDEIKLTVYAAEEKPTLPIIVRES